MFNGYRGSLPGCEAVSCNVEHSPPFNATTKTEWSYVGVSKSSQTTSIDRQLMALRECVRNA